MRQQSLLIIFSLLAVIGGFANFGFSQDGINSRKARDVTALVPALLSEGDMEKVY